MDMQSGSFPLGRLFRIPVRLHYLFLIFLVLQVLGSIYYGGLWPLYWFIILGPLLLFTVLVHELGHCLAARKVGGEAHSILLWPLGGLAFIGHDKGPKADMFVAVAGPLTHLPMIVFWLLMLLAATFAAYGKASLTLTWPYHLTWKNLGVAVCVGAVVLNISLLLFNLLVPAYPLDGGRILVDGLLTCGVAEATTCKITVGVAVPIAIGIIVWGAVKFQIITILVGIWILWSTWQLFDCSRKGQLAAHPMFAFTSRQASVPVPGPTAGPQPLPNPFAPGGSYQPPAVVQGYPVQQYAPGAPGRV